MIARRLRPTLSRALFAFVAVTLSATGCDKVPLTAPSESTITLFATATSVSATGSTDIVATVIEQAGTPVQNGTVVSFTTTLGRIEPSEARTRNGKVTVKFTADGRSGVALITAFSGGATGGGTDEEPQLAQLELSVGSAAANTITLRAEPARLAPTGGSTQIIALIRDLAGNSLPGASVAFTATAGQLSTGVAQTDANGEARTTLTTNRETTVTARVGEVDADVTVAVDIAPAVSVQFSPSAPVANQTVTFSITVNAQNGALPIQQSRIDFGDGESRQLGALSTGTTSVAHVYRNDGTYGVVVSVTDTAGSTTSQQTVVVVSPETPIGIVLTYTPEAPSINTVVTFVAATTPLGVAIDHYEWNFGDGTTSTTTGNIRTKIYTSTGKKKVTVRAVGTAGATGLGETDIIISP